MKYIVFGFLILCCINIINKKGVDKFIWLMVGMLMINSVYSPIVKSSSHLTLSLTYALSLFIDNNTTINFKKYPLKVMSVVILLIYFIIALSTQWQSVSYSLYNAILDYSISFLMLFAGYSAIKEQMDYDKILKVLQPIIFISAVYGIICFILKDNPINNLVGISDVGIDYNPFDAIRGYRINGFCNTSNPHAHVLTVGSFLLLNRKANKKNIFITILSCANLLLSDSRAPIADLMVLIVSFILLSKNVSKQVITLVASAVVLLLLVQIPAINDVMGHTLSNFLDIFKSDDNREVSGSSIELRISQFAIGWTYFLENPFWGHGFGYYGEFIYEPDTDSLGLFGMESYLLFIMVEQGGVLFVAVLIFYTTLIMYLFSFRSINQYYKVPLALTFTLIAYLLLNRPTDVFEFYFPFIGVGMRMLQICQHNKAPQYNTLL